MPCDSLERPVDVTAEASVSRRPARAVWRALSVRYISTYTEFFLQTFPP